MFHFINCTLVGIVLTTGCATNRSVEASPCEPPFGSASDFHPPEPSEEFEVATPVACGRDFYIQVRTHGRMKLGVGPAALKRGACMSPEDQPFVPDPNVDQSKTPSTGCREFEATFIAAQVIKSLSEQAITASGYGAGACWTGDEPEHELRVAVLLHDWKHVDDAVDEVVHQMLKWNIDGYFGVSVISLCPVVELGTVTARGK